MLEWYLEKRKVFTEKALNEFDFPPRINSTDPNGYTPLFLTCWKGYKTKTAGEAQQIFINRLICAELLIDAQADLNFKTPRLMMTSMHWAAFHGDRVLVEVLCE